MAGLATVAGWATAAVLALAGCGAPSAPGPTSTGGQIPVVASTNVYGDIVQAVGGDRVAVTSIISKPSQDPHSYEATSQDRLTVSKAKLVIENGGGYDPFLGALVREAKLSDNAVITAVQAAGVAGADSSSGGPSGGSAGGNASGNGSDTAHGHPSFNEHVWYDFAAMQKITTVITERLAALDPADRATFEANAQGVQDKLAALEGKVQALKGGAAGKKAAVTEPVPLYLLEAAGLTNATPEAFTAAVEEGQDAPPAALKETLDLITSKSVALLAYNPQTSGRQTDELRKAAEAAKVPVVTFAETVPEGESYLDWMRANVSALAAALA